jgi:hypothetical protein
MEHMKTDEKVVSVRFRYDGIVRHVDNISLDDKNKQFLGFEVRKSGKFSNKIKRFDMLKIDSLEFIEPAKRVRP